MTNLATGERVALRVFREEDSAFVRAAFREGEWRDYDAPFEKVPTSDEKLADMLEFWLEQCGMEPVARAMIVGKDDAPVGWLGRYAGKRFADVWSLGLCIAYASNWSAGLGTEALRLWIDYLFENSDIHKLDMATWSLNPRMMRVARKLGFRHEGVDREMVEWRGERLTRHRFGLLRREWERAPVAVEPMADGEAAACEAILRGLPDWFGIPEAIESYARDIETMETLVVREGGEVVGFITLKRFGECAAEIQVMGLHADLHRRGIGRALVEAAESRLRSAGVELFQVKTLAPSRESEHYARTRRFYEAMGFVPLEENLLWGEANPCLVMVKGL